MEEKVFKSENISLKKENNPPDIGDPSKARVMVKVEPSEYLATACSENLSLNEYSENFDKIKNEVSVSELSEDEPVDLSTNLILEAGSDFEANKSIALSCDTLEPANVDLVNVLRNIKIEKKLFNCYHCQFSSNHRSVFKRHVIFHMKSEELKCPECSHQFSSIYKMRVHLRIHTGDKPFKCDICSFSTGYPSSFKYHMRSHLGEKPYACSLCSFRSVSCTMLTRHKRVHTGERPFRCHMCDYKARAKGTLKSHLRTHTGEKPFTCTYCDKSFVTSSAIRKHLFVHLKNSERKCVLCEIIFPSKGEWREHLRTHDVSNQCQHCGSKTGSRVRFKQHLDKNKAGAPISCKFCDSKFKYKCAYSKHVVGHEEYKPFKCDECDYRGPSVASLKFHKRTKHTLLQPRKLECADCYETYDTKAKLIKHLCVRSQ